MVVSVKANKKRILAFLLLAVIVVGACLFLRGGPEAEQKEILGGTEEQRVASSSPLAGRWSPRPPRPGR